MSDVRGLLLSFVLQIYSGLFFQTAVDFLYFVRSVAGTKIGKSKVPKEENGGGTSVCTPPIAAAEGSIAH